MMRAEVLKLFGRRLYLVMVGILAVLVAITAFFLLVLAQISPDLADEGVPLITKPDAYIIGVQQVVSQTWFPLILAVIVLGGELASTVWATGLTRESSKVRHVTARVLVLTAASWLAMALGIGGWSLVTALAADGAGSPSITDWLSVAWKVGAIQLAWTSIGIGFVAMLRAVGPAIGAAIAISFGEGLLSLWDTYERVSLTVGSLAIFGDFGFGGPFADLMPGAGVSVLHSAAIILGWTTLGLLLTWWGMQRRDA